MNAPKPDGYIEGKHTAGCAVYDPSPGQCDCGAWKPAYLAPTEIPFNDDTKFIFGMMCFQAARYAHLFRRAGADIPTKTEAEQAYVIHWLLNLYLKHGHGFFDAAEAELKAAIEKVNKEKPA